MKAASVLVRPGSGLGEWPSAKILLGCLVGVKILIHLALSQNYGYFRDEFYYMQLGRHVADASTAMPLFAPLLMALNLAVLGDSLPALHLWPALAGAGVIILAVLMARELGGQLFAQAFAGLCVLVAPVYLAINSTFSYDSFDQLFWAAGLYVLVRLLKRNEPRLWLLFGLAAGLGLFTKESMLFFGFGVAVAFFITPQRRYYRTKWMWLGAGVAFFFLAPYLLMQAKLHWPTLTYWGFYTQRKTYPATPPEFLWFQILAMNPLACPVWLSGLYYALRAPAGRPYRPLGWTYIFLFLLFYFLKAKFYFLAPFYPFLFAAGAVHLEQQADRRFVRVATRAWLAVILVTGGLLAPFGAPLLPVETFRKMAAAAGKLVRIEHERHKTTALPQHFADRFGWENMAAQVAKVWRDLSPADRRRACIFTGNYGEAGAIEFFGRKLHPDLPQVISGHGQYFFWGWDGGSGELVITVGIRLVDLQRMFQTVTAAQTIQCSYSMPYENNLTIYVCRNSVIPLPDLWPALRHFD